LSILSNGTVAIVVLGISNLSAHLVTSKTIGEVGEITERETGDAEFSDANKQRWTRRNSDI
jgi:hypothetical protein